MPTDLSSNGLYRPEDSKESCGFGLIAHMRGMQSHELVSTACSALTRMTHRGAVDADGKTGDGCGVLMSFPRSFFRAVAADEGIRLDEQFAVGMVFLSQDEAQAKRSRKILEKHIERETLGVAGWRKVPLDTSVLGSSALASLPRIEQVMVNAPFGWTPHDIERRLFVARRMAFAENAKLDDPDRTFHVATLSNLVTVYKGLVMPANL
ncbi:MAG: glutamate synthase large subunit, partial [Xanthomonadales bacterium]|nr:glutamate synthase large subunit [Xanthomonadales bacterium]NIX11578.1 glutamate synthase large subunit [Xanthomonadales bacterium]